HCSPGRQGRGQQHAEELRRQSGPQAALARDRRHASRRARSSNRGRVAAGDRRGHRGRRRELRSIGRGFLMAKSSLQVESDPIRAAASGIDGAAEKSSSSTAIALGNAEKLGSSVFGALVDEIVDALRDRLSNDISLLVKSYGNGLLALANAA